jgi:hypothetical protein
MVVGCGGRLTRPVSWQQVFTPTQVALAGEATRDTCEHIFANAMAHSYVLPMQFTSFGFKGTYVSPASATITGRSPANVPWQQSGVPPLTEQSTGQLLLLPSRYLFSFSAGVSRSVFADAGCRTSRAGDAGRAVAATRLRKGTSVVRSWERNMVEILVVVII